MPYPIMKLSHISFHSSKAVFLTKSFERLDIGLSREQVKYLLGKPASSPFNNNHWNYYYFNNLDVKEVKSIVVIFKNEKVFEIKVNNQQYKKLGQERSST